MTTLGKLFVFEGPDGSGKTALSRSIADRLKASSTGCEWFSFPGKVEGTLGKHVHDIHHDASRVGILRINSTSLQLLHIAAHIDEIEARIMPALEQGRHVILDRFWWSTLVYGATAGVDMLSLKAMTDLERMHWGTIHPAVVFLVRRNAPFGKSLSLESNHLAKEYGKLAAREARKYKVTVIDNNGTLAETLDYILRVPELGKVLGIAPNRNLMPTQAACTKQLNGTHAPATPLVFSKLQPVKPTAVYDTYWRFAAERQAVFFRRLHGEPQPWTDDSILREFKFTNAYRASDRTSQYLIRKVIYDGDKALDEVFFRILLFKVFNRIETWELLARTLGHVSCRDYSFARYDAVLTKEIDRGARIYSAAYIMPSGGPSTSGGRKHRMHLKLIEQMLNDDLPKRLADAPSMGKAFELIRAYPTIGDFLAYQYLTDLNYSTLTNFSEMSFVTPGPGARDGIRKCFSDLGGLSEADIIRLVTERQQVEFERLGLTFQSLWQRPLQLIDCQNLFCEVAKYARVAHPTQMGTSGRMRIKQRYRPKSEPIRYWYPPKWGLNARIQPLGRTP